VATGLNMDMSARITAVPSVSDKSFVLPRQAAPIQQPMFHTEQAQPVPQAVNSHAYDEDQLAVPTWIRRQAD